MEVRAPEALLFRVLLVFSAQYVLLGGRRLGAGGWTLAGLYGVQVADTAIGASRLGERTGEPTTGSK